MAHDLQLSHIGKVYDNGTPAVIDFNLEVEKGEFIAFLGPSGCGKTTTLRMIAGFESITSGDLLIRGKRVNDMLPEKRPTSMIFQNYALFPHMDVRQNIRFGLVLNQLTGASGMYRSKDFVKSLPFPRMVNNKVCVHDHWLYLCAVSTGGIEFSNEILWKYRQHEHNLIGASANSPLLFRYLRGLSKVLNIITNRFVKSSDPVIHQGLIFQSELSSRYTFTLINERLDLIGAVSYRGISKLKLDVIRMTKLEALRLYLHRGVGS